MHYVRGMYRCKESGSGLIIGVDGDGMMYRMVGYFKRYVGVVFY